MAKWVDSSGNESASATAVSTDAPNVLTLNFIDSISEAPTFNGGRSNVAVVDNELVLMPAGLISEQEDSLTSWPHFSVLGGIEPYGEYLFSRYVALGTVSTAQIKASVMCVGYDALTRVVGRPFISTWASVVGDNVTDTGCRLYIRTTNDAPSGSPVWGEWTPFVVGDYCARAFQFKAVLTSAYSTHNIAIKSLSISVDMPDRVVSGEDIVSGSGVKHITFSPEFVIAPALGITAQNMASGDYYSITNKTKSGFDITFFNAGDTPISKTFDYVAQAY